MNTERLTTILVMSLVLLLGFTLLGSRLAAPYGGYQGYQEAWYTLVAENYENYSWLEPHAYVEHSELGEPPFYSYLLNIAYAALGGREWVFRLVAIAFGLVCLIQTFFIGREAGGMRAGLASAALLAVCPVFVLSARNVQPDGATLCFILAGYHFYLQFLRNKNPGTLVFSAMMLGAALFSSRTATIAIAALAISELYSNKWKIEYPKRLWLYIVVMLIIPLYYFGYQLVTHPLQLFQAILAPAPGAQLFTASLSPGEMISEMFFGLNPVLFILGAASIVLMIARRRHMATLIVFPFFIFLVYFIITRKQSADMIWMAPFLCLIAGLTLAKMERKILTAILMSLAILAGTMQTCMALGALKFGYARSQSACQQIESKPGDNILFVEDKFLKESEPMLFYYCRNVRILGLDSLIRNEKPGALLKLYYGRSNYYFLFKNEISTDIEEEYHHNYPVRVLGPAALGYLFYYMPRDPGVGTRAFAPKWVGVRRIESSAPFEMREAEKLPSVELIELPPGQAVYRSGAGGTGSSNSVRFAPMPRMLPAYEDEIDEKDDAAEHHPGNIE